MPLKEILEIHESTIHGLIWLTFVLGAGGALLSFLIVRHVRNLLRIMLLVEKRVTKLEEREADHEAV